MFAPAVAISVQVVQQRRDPVDGLRKSGFCGFAGFKLMPEL